MLKKLYELNLMFILKLNVKQPMLLIIQDIINAQIRKRAYRGFLFRRTWVVNYSEIIIVGN